VKSIFQYYVFHAIHLIAYTAGPVYADSVQYLGCEHTEADMKRPVKSVGSSDNRPQSREPDCTCHLQTR
jgi:hypothetical protein